MWFNLHSSYGLFKTFMLLVALSSVQLTYALDWVELDPKTNNNLQSINFVDSRLGFMVSTPNEDSADIDQKFSEISKTTDNGATWEVLYRAEPNVYLKSIEFLNFNVGLAVGFKLTDTEGEHTGVVLQTKDGGKTWNSIESPLFEYTSFTGISSFMAGDLVVFGSRPKNFDFEGVILKSTNDGETWIDKSPQTDGLQYIYKFVYTSPESGYFDGLSIENAQFNRVLYKTTDAFETWQKVETPYSENGHLTSFDFFLHQNGVITGYVDNIPKIFKTTDAGVTWERLDLNISDNGGIFLVRMMSKFNFVVIGENYNGNNLIYNTPDAGLSWTMKEDLDNPRKFSNIGLSYLPQMLFANYAFAIGEKGKIYRFSITNNESGALTSLPDGKLEFTSTLNKPSEPKSLTFQVDNLKQDGIMINLPEHFEVAAEKDGVYKNSFFISHILLKQNNEIFIRFNPKSEGVFTGEGDVKYYTTRLFKFDLKGTTQTASVDEEQDNSQIQLSPNPVENTLNVSIENAKNFGNAEMFDVLGNKVLETKTNPNFSIEMNNLPSGVYNLKINNQYKRFIKK